MRSLPGLLRGYASAAWRYRWYSLGVAWAICIAGWLAIGALPNRYEASTRLYVNADAVLTPLLRGIAIEGTQANEVELLQRTLLSRPDLERLVSQTPLAYRVPDPASRIRLVQRLATSVKIDNQGPNLFTISYDDTQPQVAYDVVQRMISMFMEKAAAHNHADMANAAHFLGQQIAAYADKLREAERRRAEFRARYVDLLPDTNGGASKLEAAQAGLRRLKDQFEEAKLRAARLTAELQTTQPLLVTESSDDYVAGVSPDLADAERRLAELRLKYTDSYPGVQAAKALVAALHHTGAGGRVGGGSSRSAPNPVYDQLKVDLVNQQLNVSSLQLQLTSAEANAQKLEAEARAEPGLQAEYTNMDRDYSVVKQNYEQLLGRREAMRIAAAADTDADKVKLQIIDPPQVPRIPIGPKRQLLSLAILGAGLAGGGALAVLLVQLNGCFYVAQDLKAIGLPVLGAISFARPSVLHQRLLAVASFSAAVMLLVVVCGGVVARSDALARLL